MRGEHAARFVKRQGTEVCVSFVPPFVWNNPQTLSICNPGCNCAVEISVNLLMESNFGLTANITLIFIVVSLLIRKRSPGRVIESSSFMHFVYPKDSVQSLFNIKLLMPIVTVSC